MAVVIIDDTHGRWRGLGGEVRMNGSSIPVPFLHYGQESVASKDGGGIIGDMQGRWGGGGGGRGQDKWIIHSSAFSTLWSRERLHPVHSC